MRTYRHRDLSIIELDENSTLVMACDSCGSIGEKPMDELKVPSKITGKFAVRVPLMEVLCSGAQVISVSDSVCCEMEPTGKNIIEGISDDLSLPGITPQILNGSTEENFVTHSTGVGIAVVGICRGKPHFSPSCHGDLVGCVGLPKVGAEINLSQDDEIANYDDVYFLLRQTGVNEIIPCGSKGIGYEASQAAEYSGLKLELHSESLNLEKSSGPATCVVITFKQEALPALRQKLGNKLNIIGRLYNN